MNASFATSNSTKCNSEQRCRPGKSNKSLLADESADSSLIVGEDGRPGKLYIDMLAEKELVIEKLRSELGRMRLNNQLASNIVDSPCNYSNVKDVNARRMFMCSVNSNKSGSKLAPSTEIANVSDMSEGIRQPYCGFSKEEARRETDISWAEKENGRRTPEPFAVAGTREVFKPREVNVTASAGHFGAVKCHHHPQIQKKPRKRVVLQLKDLFD